MRVAPANMVHLLGLTNQRKLESQTSELRTNVHGQSCHHVNHRGSNNSSRVGAVPYTSGACAPQVKTYSRMWLQGSLK